MVPAEPVFRSQLARSAIWYPYFSQIRKFGIRCSEKPQVRKFASRYSGYQTSCFARRWVPSRQSWRAWVPQPPNFVGNFSTRDTKPRSFVTHHALPGTKPGNSAMRKAGGIFAPQAAVYSVTNKRPHSFHLGFPEFSKSHPSLTPQPEAAFCQNRRRPAARGRFLPGPEPSLNQRTLLSLLTQLRPIEQNCHCGN